jgi:hypothetical protein
MAGIAEPDPAGAVRRHLRAFNERDVEALIAGLTEDAVWITGGAVVTGHAELTEFFAGALTALAPTLHVRTLVAGGDHVVCELVETLTAAGRAHTFHMAAFYRLRGSRIAAAKIYREGSAELP